MSLSPSSGYVLSSTAASSRPLALFLTTPLAATTTTAATHATQTPHLASRFKPHATSAAIPAAAPTAATTAAVPSPRTAARAFILLSSLPSAFVTGLGTSPRSALVAVTWAMRGYPFVLKEP